MKLRKVIKTTVLSIVMTGVVAGGIGGGIYYMRKHNKTAVELYPVSALNSAEWVHWDDDYGTSGTVRSDVSQRVTIPADQFIKDVYVSEGQEVKVGDKLVSFDTTLLELDQELQQLTVQKQQIELEAAKKDLEKLRNTTPVASHGNTNSTTYDDDESGMEEARVVSNAHEYRAVSDGDIMIAEELSDEVPVESVSPEEGNDYDGDIIIADEGNLVQSGETDVEQILIDDSIEEEKTDSYNLGVDLVGEDVILGSESQETEKQEQRIKTLSLDGFLSNIRIKSRNTDQDELLLDTNHTQVWNVELQTDISVNPHFREDAQHLFSETDTYCLDITGLNLEKMITGKVYGIAAINGDDYPEIGGYTLAMIGENKARLTIAFHDGLTKEHENDPALEDMYVELPLKMEEICSGELTFVVSDNADHNKTIEIQKLEQQTEEEEESEAEPEIKTEPETEPEKTELTEKTDQDYADVDANGEAQSQWEETGDAESESDTAEEEKQSETVMEKESESASETETGTETVMNSESESETETETISESESETETETETIGESASETETEEISESEVVSEPETLYVTESETESEEEMTETEVKETQAKKIGFVVSWDHGTNHYLRWPDAVKLFFYGDNADDVQWSLSLSENGKIRMDNASGVEGEDFGEDVEAVDVTGESSDQNQNSDGTQDGLDQDGLDQDGTSDSGSNLPVSGVDYEDYGQHTINYDGDPSQPIADEDETGDSMETWKKIMLLWPKASSFEAGEELYVWAYAENYQGSVTFDASTNTYYVSMKYQEPVDSPAVLFDPISELTYIHGVNSVSGSGMRAYKGSGTADDPYVFLVTDGVKINSSFVNWVLGFDETGTIRLNDGYVIKLEIREDDSLTGVFLRAIELDGRIYAQQGYGPGTYWIFTSENGMVKYEEEVEEPNNGGNGGNGSSDPWGEEEGESYTAEELAQAIFDKELEIRKLGLEMREAELKLAGYNKQMEQSTVVSAINGVVTSIGGDDYSGAYMVVNSKNSLYIKTSVSELELDSYEVGDQIKCSSWSSGSSFKATISKIDTVPSADNEYSSYNQNPNSSNYPVLAVVEEGVELEEYDYVQVQFPKKTQKYSDIYLEKAYIRSENGKSYVYIRGEDGKLKKQYVKTGETSYGSVEIKSGLTTSDYIAFPYGKTAKEGAATKVSSEYEN